MQKRAHSIVVLAICLIVSSCLGHGTEENAGTGWPASETGIGADISSPKSSATPASRRNQDPGQSPASTVVAGRVETGGRKLIEITAEHLKAYIDGGKKFFLIDGRGSPYYEQTIPGAVMIMEHQVVEMRHLLPVDSGMKIVAFCAGNGCKASKNLCISLMEMGYTNVENYPGGFPDWKARGYPAVVPAR